MTKHDQDKDKDDCGDDRLPVIHRTIRLPTGLWKAIKQCRGQRQETLRQIIDQALDSELPPLIDSLKDSGRTDDADSTKLVRMPVDDNIIARLNYGRRQTGIPGVQLFRICLQRFVGKRG